MKQFLLRPFAAVAGALALSSAIEASAHGPTAAADRRSGCVECGVVTAVKPVPRKAKVVLTGASPASPPSPASSAAAGPSAPEASGAAPTVSADAGEPAPAAGRKRNAYEVVIRMDSGSEQRIFYENRPSLAIGDKVRIRQNQIYLQ